MKLIFLFIVIAITFSCNNCYHIINLYHKKFILNKILLYNTINNEIIEKTIESTSNCCNNTINNCIQPIDSSFIVDITSDEITNEELDDTNLVKIVQLTTSDEQANQLCWKCLGYRYNNITNTYNNDKVFPKWLKKYPQPPDLIGITRIYDPSVDKVVRDASMDLMRSIPRDFKGGIRNLINVGFKGFLLKELTPNKTRRAQLVNWLIYYREKLYGKSLQQLQAEKDIEKAVSNDIANLPSEQLYQKLRLDENI